MSKNIAKFILFLFSLLEKITLFFIGLLGLLIIVFLSPIYLMACIEEWAKEKTNESHKPDKSS